MHNLIQQTFVTYLPPKKKVTPSGWTSFNAPCCHNQGETADTRGRGGVRIQPDGSIQFHCFNCGYKANYTPGRNLNFKMKKLMGYIGFSTEVIRKMGLEALRHIDENVEYKREYKPIHFTEKPLPKKAKPVMHWVNEKDLPVETINRLVSAIEFVTKRSLELEDYPFYYSTSTENQMEKRILIPFYHKHNIIGYTARWLGEKNYKIAKYFTDVPPGYVFNCDKQNYNRQYVLVMEGPLDAIALDGVAVLGSEPNKRQQEMINNLQRKVIVVPDRDEAGNKMISRAIDYGWSVAFPQWESDIIDVGDAVIKYGKLLTMKSILHTTVDTKIKIELQRKLWYNKI
jgi:hypothetical protein